MTTPPAFTLAAFVIDGECEGLAQWSLDRLSAKWLAFCRDLLQSHSAACDVVLPGPLSHVRVKITRADGVALVDIYVRGHVATSGAVLSGKSPTEERQVLRLFVDSLKRVRLVQAAATSPQPFEEAFTISARPLAIVVPWPNGALTEQDLDVARELNVHLAGAILMLAEE